MLKAISTADTWTFESEDDPARGTPAATRFKLGVLDVFLRARIMDGGTEFGHDGAVHIKNNEMLLEAARFGLRGWENFQDENGNDIPFETVKLWVQGREYTVVSDTCLARLPSTVALEIGREVRDGQQVPDDVAKNSDEE